VVAELVKQRSWSAESFDLYHFRDRDGPEVDIVLEFEDGAVFLLEIKASATFRVDFFSPLRALAARLGDRFLGGAVLGLASEGLLHGERLWGLPLAALWEAVPT